MAFWDDALMETEEERRRRALMGDGATDFKPQSGQWAGAGGDFADDEPAWSRTAGAEMLTPQMPVGPSQFDFGSLNGSLPEPKPQRPILQGNYGGPAPDLGSLWNDAPARAMADPNAVTADSGLGGFPAIPISPAAIVDPYRMIAGGGAPMSRVAASDLYDSVRPDSRSRAPAGVNQQAWDAAEAAQDWRPGMRKLANGHYIPDDSAGYAIRGDSGPMLALLQQAMHGRISSDQNATELAKAKIMADSQRLIYGMKDSTGRENIGLRADEDILKNPRAAVPEKAAAAERLQRRGSLTPEEVVGQAFASFQQPDDAGEAAGMLAHLIANPQYLPFVQSRLKQRGFDDGSMDRSLQKIMQDHDIRQINTAAGPIRRDLGALGEFFDSATTRRLDENLNELPDPDRWLPAKKISPETRQRIQALLRLRNLR